MSIVHPIQSQLVELQLNDVSHIVFSMYRPGVLSSIVIGEDADFIYRSEVSR